jgi:hypothetical protein
MPLITSYLKAGSKAEIIDMPFLATMPSFMLFKEGAQLFH